MKVGHACAFLTTLALSLAAMIPAEAATLTLDWSATAASSAANGYFPFTGSGTLTVTTGASGDLVTNITGSFTSNGGTSVTDVVTGVGPVGSGSTITDNLVFPIGTTFTGTSASYISVANLDTHGLAFDTTAGVFVIYSTVVPNASPSEATGNFYSQVPAGGGFGVGVFNLVPAPLPAALPLFATGLSALGLLGWRRKRTARSVTT
jgi:hypothetical protein